MKQSQLALGVSLLVVLSSCHMTAAVSMKFTKLECEELDRPFATIKQCILKAIDRNTVNLNLHVALLQTPVTNISVNARLYQRNNGYRNMILNTTGDFCRFMERPQRLVFWNLILTELRPYSNINHSCPFDHDIIIKGLLLSSNILKLIPFLANEYILVAKVGAYHSYKAEVRLFMKLV